MSVKAPTVAECPRRQARRERKRAIEALAAAYRAELELAERFARIGDGEAISPEEVDRAIDDRQFAEARLAEWAE